MQTKGKQTDILRKKSRLLVKNNNKSDQLNLEFFSFGKKWLEKQKQFIQTCSERLKNILLNKNYHHRPQNQRKITK